MTTGWILFGGLILLFLALDLLVFGKKAHVVSFKEAIFWTCVWISLALLFDVYIYFQMGPESALNFLTGYLIEKTLSFDNLFVFVLIFNYFRTPAALYHKVLFWGILGAVVTRALMILLGLTLVQKFHFVIYLFGAFLIIAGLKSAFKKPKDYIPGKNYLIQFFQKIFPITPNYRDDHFFIREKARIFATPLWVTLLAVEMADIIFAIDSIPAILAITFDPFIVYTSNIFAILGLRALFLVLIHALKLFEHLHYGVALILIYVGLKMLLSGIIKIPSLMTLVMIFGILILSILASVLFKKKR